MVIIFEQFTTDGHLRSAIPSCFVTTVLVHDVTCIFEFGPCSSFAIKCILKAWFTVYHVTFFSWELLHPAHDLHVNFLRSLKVIMCTWQNNNGRQWLPGTDRGYRCAFSGGEMHSHGDKDFWRASHRCLLLK